MTRLVVVHPWADGDRRWESELSALVQAGFDAGAAVRLVTPRSCGSRMVRTVPTERVLPDPAEGRSSDPVSALLDDALFLPVGFAESLAGLGLHANDVVLFPVAGACELLGIARWMTGRSWPGCAVLAGLPPVHSPPDDPEQRRLFHAVGNQLRRGATDRLALLARDDDAGWYAAAGLPSVLVGELCAPGAGALAELLVPWPSPGPGPKRSSMLPALVDARLVRRGFKLPEHVAVVVIWGEEGAHEVLAALTTVPWAASALVIVVGASPDIVVGAPPEGQFPLTVGTLVAPASDEEMRVVAALGDLHVVPGTALADQLARPVMEQGRALLCRPTPELAGLLSAPQTIEGPLETRLCGLLLRRELLAALGRRNRHVLEGALCGPV